MILVDASVIANIFTKELDSIMASRVMSAAGFGLEDGLLGKLRQ